MTKEKHVERLFAKFFEVMEIHDGNPEVDLSRTPERVARMYVQELLSGYDPQVTETLRRTFTVFNKARRHELVVIQHIPYYSLCAHHLMPFFGTADFGYLPGKQVIGLSKLPRVVRHFSRRLQTQENLTGQIADFVWEEAKPEALILVVKGTHLCCAARGIEKPGVVMTTSAIRPQETFSPTLKEEFYRLLGS